MEKGYRFIDHTADAGLEAYGHSPEEAFENAFRGLLALLADAEAIRPAEGRRLEVEGLDREDLLVRWLGEILFLVEAGWLPAEARIEELGRDRLLSALRGEPWDPARHRLRAEVKAVTYHGLEVAEEDGRWRARVIFDL